VPNPNKEILRLAIPNIASNISIPLLSAVDTYLMGQIPDPKYLGAIALGSAIFNFVFWSLGFLRMGTTGMTAQAFGQDDQKKIMALLVQGLVVAVLLAVALLLFQKPFLSFSLWALGGSEGVHELAGTYFNIRIWAIPAALIMLVMNGWFFGMQNTVIPLIVTILVNLCNIFFNLLFVRQMGMNADGVAMGTLIAQYIGLVATVILFFYRYRHLIPKWEDIKERFDKSNFNQFFTVNRDIFIRTICLVFVFTFFSSISARSGDVVLSANQILLLFLTMISYAIDGFAHAAESLVGKYTGSKQTDSKWRSVRYSFYWGGGFALLFLLFFVVFGRWMIGVFAENEAVQAVANDYLPWLCLMPIVASAAYIWDGIYIGATAVKPMRNSMVVATFGIFLPLYYMLAPLYGNHALWLAVVLFMLARSIFLGLLARKALE